MNERIRELAEHCGAEFFESSRDYFGDTYPAGILTDKVDLQKFAELLIRECASIVYRTCEDGDAGAQAILYEFDIDDAKSQK